MPNPFLNFLVLSLIFIGKSCLRWSNFRVIDSPACRLFVCHVLLFFSVVFLLYDAVVFQKTESMTRDASRFWITSSPAATRTLHHPGGDPCESWGSGISLKGVTSRAVQKCCFDTSDASIQHLYESR